MEAFKYFFSYARKDSEFVLKLAQELRSAGANFWLDQLDIRGGQRWDRAVEEALEACHGMIAVLSPEAVASNNVMDEVSYALEKGKLVLPLLLRPCEIPFRLRRVQYVDFTADHEAGLAGLLKALHFEQPSAASKSLAPHTHLAQELERPLGTASTGALRVPERQVRQRAVVVVGDATAADVVRALREARVSVSDDRSSIGSASLVVVALDATKGPTPVHREIVREINRAGDQHLLCVLTNTSGYGDLDLLELVVSEALELFGDSIYLALDDVSSEFEQPRLVHPLLKGWVAIIRFVAKAATRW
jgi:uncharacterized protein (UPF0218 family)